MCHLDEQSKWASKATNASANQIYYLQLSKHALDVYSSTHSKPPASILTCCLTLENTSGYLLRRLSSSQACLVSKYFDTLQNIQQTIHA